MLSDKFHFAEFTSPIVFIDFDTKENLLSEININVEGLKSDEILEFTEEEIHTIEQFKELIVRKKQLINNKKRIQNAIQDFAEKVDKIIKVKNDTLESSSRAKNEAFRRKK